MLLVLVVSLRCGSTKSTANQSSTANPSTPATTDKPAQNASFINVSEYSTPQDTAWMNKHKFTKPAQQRGLDRSIDTTQSAPIFKPSERHSLKDDKLKK